MALREKKNILKAISRGKDLVARSVCKLKTIFQPFSRCPRKIKQRQQYKARTLSVGMGGRERIPHPATKRTKQQPPLLRCTEVFGGSTGTERSLNDSDALITTLGLTRARRETARHIRQYPETEQEEEGKREEKEAKDTPEKDKMQELYALTQGPGRGLRTGNWE